MSSLLSSSTDAHQLKRRYLTCRAEGGFAGESDESRAPEFRTGFEARLAEVEQALSKHGGPFFLGCAAAACVGC